MLERKSREGEWRVLVLGCYLIGQSADHWQRRHLNKSLKEVREERCRCQEKRVLGRENSPCEGPRVGTCLVYSGNRGIVVGGE